MGPGLVDDRRWRNRWTQHDALIVLSFQDFSAFNLGELATRWPALSEILRAYQRAPLLQADPALLEVTGFPKRSSCRAPTRTSKPLAADFIGVLIGFPAF